MSAIVTVTFQAKPGNGTQLRNALAQNNLSGVPGFKSATLYVDAADPDRLFEIAEWDSHDQHKTFLKGLVESGALGPMMEMLAAQPDIRYLNRG